MPRETRREERNNALPLPVSVERGVGTREPEDESENEEAVFYVGHIRDREEPPPTTPPPAFAF
ncbi:hypothetical protein K0M31_013383 [Melipona bicolor]|uniref:Uncharacterized protein n=1 Tax=Melipona bicolor TaxID=60889 RepID=A0AA40KGU9_9HYME|nr:hypothetical protein K0M31_013383 [Melipona bicolor]